MIEAFSCAAKQMIVTIVSAPDFGNDGHPAVGRLGVVRGLAIALAIVFAIALPIGQAAARLLRCIGGALGSPGVWPRLLLLLLAHRHPACTSHIKRLCDFMHAIE